MEGDLAPVAELSALARAHDAWLMTDDAHGLGICVRADGRRPDGHPLEGGRQLRGIRLRAGRT